MIEVRFVWEDLIFLMILCYEVMSSGLMHTAYCWNSRAYVQATIRSLCVTKIYIYIYSMNPAELVHAERRVTAGYEALAEKKTRGSWPLDSMLRWTSSSSCRAFQRSFLDLWLHEGDFTQGEFFEEAWVMICFLDLFGGNLTYIYIYTDLSFSSWVSQEI